MESIRFVANMEKSYGDMQRQQDDRLQSDDCERRGN